MYGTVEEVGISVASNSVSYPNDKAPKLSILIRPEGTQDDDNLVAVPVTSQSNSDVGGTYVYVYDTSSDTAYSVLPADIELTGKKVYCFIYNAQAKAIIVYE